MLEDVSAPAQYSRQRSTSKLSAHLPLSRTYTSTTAPCNTSIQGITSTVRRSFIQCAHASPSPWRHAPRLPKKPARPLPLTLQRSRAPRACVSRPSIGVFDQCPATPIVVSRPGLVRRHLVHRALAKILNCGKAPTLTRLK